MPETINPQENRTLSGKAKKFFASKNGLRATLAAAIGLGFLGGGPVGASLAGAGFALGVANEIFTPEDKKS